MTGKEIFKINNEKYLCIQSFAHSIIYAFMYLHI